MGPVEMLLGGLPNHQTTPINTTTMSKKRHTKEAQIKAIRDQFQLAPFSVTRSGALEGV